MSQIKSIQLLKDWRSGKAGDVVSWRPGVMARLVQSNVARYISEPGAKAAAAESDEKPKQPKRRKRTPKTKLQGDDE